MTCDEVRAHLLEQPVSTFEALAPHMEACPDCRALAHRIRTAEEDIAMDLDDFVSTGDFAAGWSAAVVAPAPRRTLPVQSFLIAAAAAAALLLALPAAWVVSSSGPSLERSDPPPSAGVPAVPVPADDGCPTELGDAIATRAVGGALREGERECLEGDVVDGTELGPDAFRLLLVDAWARDDHDRWEMLVLEHLDEMEPDAELLVKVLLHFARRDDVEDARWDGWEERFLEHLAAMSEEERKGYLIRWDLARQRRTDPVVEPPPRMREGAPPRSAVELEGATPYRPPEGVERRRPLFPPEPEPPAFEGRTVERLVFFEGVPAGTLYVDGERVGPLAQQYLLPVGIHELEVRCGDVVVGRMTHNLTDSGSRILRLHEWSGFVSTIPEEERRAICGG